MNNKKPTIRILKSSSYVCCLCDEATETNKQLLNVVENFNSRSFFARDYQEFTESIGSVAIFTAVFIDAKLLADTSVDQVIKDLADLKCEIFFLNAPSKEHNKPNVHLLTDYSSSEKFILLNLEKLRPVRIAELCAFSSNSLVPFFFPKNDKLIFSEIEKEGKFNADYTLSCQVQATNIFGYCFMKIDTLNLEILLGDNEITNSEFLLMDFAKELLNQFWGVVCQNIAKKGIYPNIGLPIACDSKGNAGMSKRYVPKIYLKDNSNAFFFELGFMAQDQTLPFDLTGVEFTTSSKNGEDIDVELF